MKSFVFIGATKRRLVFLAIKRPVPYFPLQKTRFVRQLQAVHLIGNANENQMASRVPSTARFTDFGTPDLATDFIPQRTSRDYARMKGAANATETTLPSIASFFDLFSELDPLARNSKPCLLIE